MEPIRVLIVEDDPMVAEINKSFTERVEGFLVAGVVRNGAEAQHFLERAEVDLVILDVYMPECDGVTLLSMLRKREKPVDVIMITAATDASTVSTAMRHGVVGYIIKPFKFERFMNTLDSYKIFRSKLGQNETFCQEELDRVLPLKQAKTAGLPKNYDPRTMEVVSRFLAQSATPQSAEEVAAGTGIARVTARRYLEYLVQQGKLQVLLEYSVGRPVHRYCPK